jgi:hypothetical protein
VHVISAVSSKAMRAPLLAVVLALSLAPSTAHAGDAKTECIGAADQGQSLRDTGKYRQAREAFAVCSRDVCPKVVARSCADWLRELDAATPTVVLGARDEHGADVAGVTVSVDGAPLPGALDGQPVPMDPGAHVLRFTRPGSEPGEERVVLRVGEKNRAVTVTLRPSAPAAPPVDGIAPAPEGGHASVSGARAATALSMLVLGGVGIAGGAVLFGQSGSQSSTAAGLRSSMPSYACTDAPSSAPCQQLGSAVDAQHRDATLGAVLVAGGGALLVGGVVAWFLWPRSEATHEPSTTGRLTISPFVAGRTEGVSLGGAF